MKDDELIAKFIYPNWIHPKEQFGDDWMNLSDANKVKDSAGGSWSNLMFFLNEEYERFGFSTSWDALMPVIIKMWGITGHRSMFYQDVTDKTTLYGKRIGEPFSEKQILAEAYDLVIIFIKWYNKNKEHAQRNNRS